jgi:electron transport complex protein RnfD
VFSLLTGGLLLGAFFFATDASSAPKTSKGQLLFGLGLGVLTVIIRVYATFVEGVTFSIIIMSAISPLLDKAPQENLEKEGD